MSICEHPAPALGLVINCLGLVISQCSVHSNKIEDLRSTPGWTCFATRNCNLWGCKLLGLPSCSLFPIVNVPSRLSSFPSIDPRGGTTHSSRRSTVFHRTRWSRRTSSRTCLGTPDVVRPSSGSCPPPRHPPCGPANHLGRGMSRVSEWMRSGGESGLVNSPG